VVEATVKKGNFLHIYMGNISQYDSGERCGPWASCLGVTYGLLIHALGLTGRIQELNRRAELPTLLEAGGLGTAVLRLTVGQGECTGVWGV
jgi:hypothetical protein